MTTNRLRPVLALATLGSLRSGRSALLIRFANRSAPGHLVRSQGLLKDRICAVILPRRNAYIACEFDVTTSPQLFAVSFATDIYCAFPVSNSGIEFLIVDYWLYIELYIETGDVDLPGTGLGAEGQRVKYDLQSGTNGKTSAENLSIVD